jgi:hypothetical protein
LCERSETPECRSPEVNQDIEIPKDTWCQIVNFEEFPFRGIRAVVVLAPVVLASGHNSRSYASIRGMEEPKGLRRGYFPVLSSVRSMEALAGNPWKSRME